MININIIFIFIIIDKYNLCTLWDENIFRRILHHIQNSYYNPLKIPFIIKINNKSNLLSYNDINIIKNIFNNIIKPNCANNISLLMSSLSGGNYSKRCTLYYNDFNDIDKQILDNIGNKFIPYFENIINKKLILGNSDFRCTILSYEEEDANFAWHYDTEHAQCYRVLFLFDSEGNISPFSYINNKGIKTDIKLSIGDGIFFKGTETYHGVDKSNDKNQIRRMIGWQYIETPILTIDKKSLCSELRSKNFKDYIILFLPYIIIFSLIINYIYYNIYQTLIDDKYLYIIIILIFIYYHKNIYIVIKFLLICLFFTGCNINISLVLFSYIILSELLKISAHN
jgi:hypothetical protein